jgi:hypothetical protein
VLLGVFRTAEVSRKIFELQGRSRTEISTGLMEEIRRGSGGEEAERASSARLFWSFDASWIEPLHVSGYLSLDIWATETKAV